LVSHSREAISKRSTGPRSPALRNTREINSVRDRNQITNPAVQVMSVNSL
jgi:hypothetical protein